MPVLLHELLLLLLIKESDVYWLNIFSVTLEMLTKMWKVEYYRNIVK
jgi:hypothetical protein